MLLLKEIIIVFTIAVAVLYICNRIKIPSIVGFLLTGMITGPHALRLVSSAHDVEVLSEIGVVLLLFTIGMEFSLKSLFQIRRSVLLGGVLQVGITIAAVFGSMVFFGSTPQEALFYGFLVSLSSTAIVLKVLQERSEIDSPHGRAVLAILIFQDIIVVPMMLIAPVIAGDTSGGGDSFYVFLAKTMGVIGAFIVCVKWVVPWLFYQITRTRSRELFLLTLVVTCFLVALLTYSIGLSLALGAFLAGLIVSETDYSHEAISIIIPFRDIFTSIFFISIGMLLNLQAIADNPVFIPAAGAALILLKFIVVLITLIILGYQFRLSLMSGLALAQIGEFSFILSKTGIDLKLLSEQNYQLFLAFSVFSMLATPFIIKASPAIASLLSKIPIPPVIREGYYKTSLNAASQSHIPDGHIIIVGFGVNGRNLSRSAKMSGIPYIIIEMNPDTVRTEQEKGESIFYGDASHEEVLKHAHIDSARVLVIAIPDAAAVRRVTVTAKQMNPLIHLIARTRFVQEVEPLRQLGADEVIPEEFETSVEIFTRVLSRYNVPRNDIEKFIDVIRADSYSMYRKQGSASAQLNDQVRRMKGVEFVTFRVEPGSRADGSSIVKCDFRKKYNVTVISVYRGDKVFNNPGPDRELKAEDILLVIGSPESMHSVRDVFVNNISRVLI
jgi:CPA2 family monovalent cation:H+ antiporter-2